MNMFHLKKEKLRDLGYIIARNVFVLTNAIICVVVFLLFIFGDVQAALFLGVLLLINMGFGLGQDIRAWLALAKLQLLTAPRILCVNADGTEVSVLIEAVQKGDQIRLKIGDQVPCDGVLVEAQACELNEGLITGESNSLQRETGEHVLAGSIITAGGALMRVENIFIESRIARMTEGLKGYSSQMSPIQKAVNTVIVWSGYVLCLAILFAVVRGVIMHEPNIFIVKHVGALASTLVPQGLVFAMTLLFAYGAAHLFRRNVLLQEVNATEKLGRIENLCMDKTGTLTENMLVVERLDTPPGIGVKDAETLTLAYLAGSGDSSQTITAIKQFLPHEYPGKVLDGFSFSSWRPYGAVKVAEENGDMSVVVAGAPESLLPHIKDEDERLWLQRFLDVDAKEGKRIFCITRAEGTLLPRDLTQSSLSLVAVFVFASQLRPGIREAIEFFQARGVRIRVISGDSPETVRAVARSAGVRNCDQLITGKEMEKWTAEDFDTRAKEYTIFARTVPEQKEKIIEALKKDGFTAMVGDGANDALAMKKADLGIAMFEGAPATRQLASVVLTNNSFTALPGGVELADSIIKNAEIFASIFFNQAFVGFFFFVFISCFGYAYPLTPLNITLINYFAIGIPGILISYWTLRPVAKVSAPTKEKFLKRVLPFVMVSSFFQSIVIFAVFLLSPNYMKALPSNFFVIVAFVITGLCFFMIAPRVYRGALALSQMWELTLLFVIEILLFLLVLGQPYLLRFFEVTL